MEDWIRQLLGLAGNPIKDLVAAIEARIANVWATFTGLGQRIRSGLADLRAWGQSLISSALGYVGSLALTLRYIMFTFIPRQVGAAVATVRTYVVGLIQHAIAAARADLIIVRDWLAGLVANVTATLNTWTRWAFARIGELRTDANALLDRVFNLWGTPERMADWLADAMVNAIIRWVNDHAVSIGRRIVAARVQIALGALHWAEDIVTRIL